MRWLVAGLVLHGAAAHAQEALINALAVDSVQAQANALQNQPASPASLPPAQPHLGPVKLELGAYMGLEANDNINYVETGTESDLIIHSGLNLGFTWPATERSQLSLLSDVGYAKYLFHPENDSVEINPGSALTWEFTFTDGSLTLYDKFSDSQSVVSQASVAGVSRLPQIDNTVGARAVWLPGKWFWELDYSHDNFFSDDAAFNYLNRSSEYLVFRGARRLAPNTQLGVEASASLTEYEQAIQSNNRSLSVGPYLSWAVTQSLHINARGGYTFYDFDAAGTNSPAVTLDSYYAGLTMTHQLTRHISQSLSVERNISLGYNRGNNYNEQITANYTVNWAATTHLGLGLNLTYENGRQPLEVFNVFHFTVPMTEHYSRVGISPGVSYQITHNLRASLNYTYWNRTSEFPGDNFYLSLPKDGYRDDDLLLEVNYSF